LITGKYRSESASKKGVVCVVRVFVVLVIQDRLTAVGQDSSEEKEQ
jgi:hypothetical protein